MSYSIEVNGIRYKTESQEAFKELSKANGSKSEVDEVLQNYGNQIQKASEDDLVVIDNSIEEDAGEYVKAVGLDQLDEDCSVDDIEDVYNKLEDELSNMDSLFNSVDYTNPESVNEVLDKANGLFEVVNALAQTLGADLSGIDMGAGTANGICSFATTVAGAGLGVAAAASAGIITSSLTVAGATVSIPYAGWIIAGCALVVAGVSWLIGHNQQKKAEQKLEDMKNGIQDKAEELEDKTKDCMEKYQEETRMLIPFKK